MGKIDPLNCLLKCGLVLVCVGWAFGSWWICCSGDTSHHFHEVYLRGKFQGQNDNVVLVDGPKIEATDISQAEKVASPRVGQNPSNSMGVNPVKIIGTRHGGDKRPPGGKEQQINSIASVTHPLLGHENLGPEGDDPASASREVYHDVDGTLVTRGTIFLVLAAYREQRGSRTIAHAFKMATRPDDLFVGIFQQRDPNVDPQALNFSAYCSGANPTHPVCSRKNQIRSTEIDWKLGEGPCVARAEAEKMIGSEEFVFQIDSHSTFVKGWDDILINMWRKTKNEFAVLSAYPRSEGEMNHKGAIKEGGEMNQGAYKQIPLICSANMLDWSVRSMLKNNPGYQNMQDAPVRTAYFGAGLVFSKSHRVRRVPYDKYLRYLFDGEEFDMAMRLFTHGYDVYAPNETPIFHFYSSPAMNHKMGIQKFWDYKWGQRFPIMFRATRRVRHKIGIPAVMAQDPKINDTDLDEFDRHSNGDRRTVEQFLGYAGIDLIGKKVAGCCLAVKQKGGIAHVPWNKEEADPFLHPGLYANFN